jgi:hypothetical protein
MGQGRAGKLGEELVMLLRFDECQLKNGEVVLALDLGILDVVPG